MNAPLSSALLRKALDAFARLDTAAAASILKEDDLIDQEFGYTDLLVSKILALRPDVLIKGSDYTVDQVVGGDLVQGWGGKVVLVTLEEGHSTTGTIRRMTTPG